MDVIQILGGVKLEPSEIKVERETVEIGIDDICNLSDEQVIPNIANENVREIVVKKERKEVSIIGKLKDESLLDNDEEHFPNIENTNVNKIVFPEENRAEGVPITGELDINENQDYEDFNAVDNLESGEKLILNFATTISGITIKPKRSVHANGVNWAEVYRTSESTNIEKDMIKVKITKGPLENAIVSPHEYTTLTSNKHVCNHCQQACRSLKKLKEHIKMLHRKFTKLYHCPYCPYKSKWELQKHIILKHKDDKDIHWFTCYMCNMKFKLKTALAKHIRSHLPLGLIPDPRKQCYICDKIFKTPNAMRRHIRFVHNKEKKRKLQCDQCEYRTTVYLDMKNHIEVHHTAADKLQEYKCSQCDYKSKFTRPFQRHVDKHNSHYFCETCGYIARTSACLKLHQITHQEKIDDNVLKFRCNKCSYKTYRQYNLEVHKLNHLKPHEVKYFYCYHCNFKANRKNNLKTHVLRHFKKEEVVLNCYLCSFSAKQRNLLTNHISKHSKEKTEPKVPT